ncbi:hypothetical protein HK105_206952 [Polyrhizophydium stewartii]|uniref:Uncharacterized protein n=1 Tax=Polyrhizophydium stewartii TaxID=2732419 RepID=A0ABR4N1U3_9FUNG|nr:hypothetical protein HK105_002481 [Polyrhizophydium stewartii]
MTAADPTKATALWSLSADLEERTWIDWLEAHTSFMFPLHHFEGNVQLTDTHLVLEGRHKRDKNQSKSLRIAKDSIVSVTHGFDQRFRRGDERSLGLVFSPVIISFRNSDKSDETETVYIGFDVTCLRTNHNEQWCSEINRWRAGELLARDAATVSSPTSEKAAPLAASS